jgi:hypothetical protein
MNIEGRGWVSYPGVVPLQSWVKRGPKSIDFDWNIVSLQEIFGCTSSVLDHQSCNKLFRPSMDKSVFLVKICVHLP